VPTVWDWWAKVIAELDAPASRSEWIASRTAAFVAVVKSVEDRLAGKDDATFDARYYRDARGAMPVLAYIKQQQTPVSASIRRRIEFLNKLTVDRPFLAYPHGDALQGRYGDGFFELRIKAGVHHRILYRPYGRTAVLLHVFPKKGDDVPESDKLIAYNRWTDLTDRLDTLPDPIGDAAP
jgi:phage-related protein